MCSGRFMRDGRRHTDDDCLEKIASAEDDKRAKASDADIKHLLVAGEYFMVLVMSMLCCINICLRSTIGFHSIIDIDFD